MNELILHICLICGAAQMISVEEYHKTLDDDEVGGVMYGCVKCDYTFSITHRVDPDDPDWKEHLFNQEDVDKWKDEDWKRIIAEYFERHPDEKKMLDYQQAVTYAFAKKEWKI